MPRYESVCDCCMQTFSAWSPELEQRACPACGVGHLLGPWLVAPRFDETPGLGPVRFRKIAEDVAERN